MKRASISVFICMFATDVLAQAGRDYFETIQEVAGMVGHSEMQRLAQANGLQILNVMWEDTGRFEGSSVGPNISDVTLEVSQEGQTALMPVLRFPNFSDKTSDVRLDRFFLRVG